MYVAFQVLFEVSNVNVFLISDGDLHLKTFLNVALDLTASECSLVYISVPAN